MTWNIRNPCKGSGRNVGRAAEIATYAPQVIGLQEARVGDAERIRHHLQYLYGLVYHVEYGPVRRSWSRCGGVPWSPGGFGRAILSAAPMTDPVNVEYPEGGSEDRGYMAVTTLVDGTPVRVFNAAPDAAELAVTWGLAADADPECGPSAARTCGPTTDWRSKFDYILLRGFAPLDHGTHLTPHSDHDLARAI